MLTDPIFRIALTVSLFAHMAVIVPMKFFARAPEPKTDIVELNYIVIENPSLAVEEEVYSSTAENIGQGEPETLPAVDCEMLTAQSEDREQEAAFLEYYSLIREKIRAKIHSTPGRDQKGSATIIFTVTPDGRLQDVHCVALDMHASAGQKVLCGVKKASPFPSFPEELGNVPLNFSLTVKFAAS